MAHASPKYQIRTATAPYNFVSLPAAVLRARAEDAASLDRFVGHSGWLDCELSAETPTYIRGMYTVEDFLAHGTKRMDELNALPDVQRRRAEFFKDAQGRLQIPASSLRGLLRTLFEIGAHGKMGRVSRRRMAFRSFEALNAALAVHYRNKVNPAVKGERNTSVPQVRAGYMRRRGDGWLVQPARTLRGATFCRVGHRTLEEVKPRFRSDEDLTIWVKPGEVRFQEVRGGLVKVWLARAEDVSATEAPGYYKGVLSRSGEIDKKASEVIVYPPDDGMPEEKWLKTEYALRDPRDGRTLNVDVVADYEAQLTPAQRKLLGDRGVLHDGHAVLYVERVDDSGAAVVDAIGHTMMMRVLYRYSPRDLLPAEMRDDAVQDLTEAVFGYVRDGKTTDGRAASAGRVHVTPGICQSTTAEAEAATPVVPRILGSPKPTTFQHYVVQSQPDDIGQLRHFDTPGAQLRGYKMYWHKGRTTVNDLVDPAVDMKRPLDTQHTMIRPVKPGTKFRFQVHFENLSDLELGALLWVMDLAPAASARRLKLGMAKAYGAGSVSIDAALHLIDRRARYATLLEGDAWATAETGADGAAEAARAAFRTALLSDKRLNRGGAASIEDLPRVRELLTMLAWPGTDARQKDYMPLKSFRGRPVLPAPADIGRENLLPGKPEITDPRAEEIAAPIVPVAKVEEAALIVDLIPEVRDVVDEKAVKLMDTISARAIVEGEEYGATITAATKKAYECLLEDGKTSGTLERDLAVGNPSVGKSVRVKVRKITQIGGYVLTMKGVKQG